MFRKNLGFFMTSFLSKKFTGRLLVTLILGVALGIIITVARNYVDLYSHVQGILLPNGTVIGGDFICFYLAGKIFAENPASLYDFQHMFSLQQDLFQGTVAEGRFWPFAYPPLVGWFFSFFSALSLLQAYYVWLAISLLLALLAFFLVFDSLKLSAPQKFFFFILAFAFTPLSIDCLAGGQTSCVGLLIYALVFVLFRSGRDFRAGLVLAFAYYKPPLFLVFVLLMFFCRKWKLMSGFLLMTLVLLVATLALVGWDGLMSYLIQGHLYSSGQEIIAGYQWPQTKGVVLYSLISVLCGESGLVAVLLLIAIAAPLLFYSYRFIIAGLSQPDSSLFDLAFSLALSLSIFLALYLVKYDIAIMLIPLMIVVVHLSRRNYGSAGVLCALVVIGFYAVFVDQSFFVGVTEVKIVTLLLAIWIGSLLWLLNRAQSLHKDVPG